MNAQIMDKQAIRQDVRKRRNALTPQEQQHFSRQLVDQVLSQSSVASAKRIGLYLSFDGELNTHDTIEALWDAGKRVYVPVLHPFRKGYLVFVEYSPSTPMVRNQFNIQEPKLTCQQICPLSELDILFTPLVAFDESGNRLGMGGGFYDRTLSIHQRESRTKPELIGLAHDCQKYDALPIEPWDIKVNKIVTPSLIYTWSQN